METAKGIPQILSPTPLPPPPQRGKDGSADGTIIMSKDSRGLGNTKKSMPTDLSWNSYELEQMFLTCDKGTQQMQKNTLFHRNNKWTNPHRFRSVISILLEYKGDSWSKLIKLSVPEELLLKKPKTYLKEP